MFKIKACGNLSKSLDPSVKTGAVNNGPKSIGRQLLLTQHPVGSSPRRVAAKGHKGKTPNDKNQALQSSGLDLLLLLLLLFSSHYRSFATVSALLT